MSQDNIDAIGERVARLEREIRLWKRCGTATLILFGAMIVLSCAKGPERARATDSDNPSLDVRRLRVVDKGGNPRIVLEATELGPELVLNDEHGKRRAELSTNKEGLSRLLLFGENERDAGLTVDNDLSALGMSDEHKKIRIFLSNTKDGPSLNLCDEHQKSRLSLSNTEDGPSVNLYDEHEKKRAVFGTETLLTPRTGATENTGPSAITLFGTNGKIIWKAP